jgi:hypothetical protein
LHRFGRSLETAAKASTFIGLEASPRDGSSARPGCWVPAYQAVAFEVLSAFNVADGSVITEGRFRRPEGTLPTITP